MRRKLALIIALALIISLLPLNALAVSVDRVTVKMPPGKSYTLTVPLKFNGTIKTFQYFNGDSSIIVYPSTAKITGGVLEFKAMCSTTGKTCQWLIITEANDQAYVTIECMTGVLPSGTDSTAAAVTMLPNTTQRTDIAFYDIQNLKSNNESVAYASISQSGSSANDGYISVSGKKVGTAVISFRAADASNGVATDRSFVVKVSETVTNYTTTTSSSTVYIPSVVTVDVGATKTYFLNYNRIMFPAAANSSNYNSLTYSDAFAQVSYTGGTLTVKGLSQTSSTKINYRYMVNANETAKDGSFMVAVNAAATPTPTPYVAPTPTPAPVYNTATGSLKFGSFESGTTKTLELSKYKNKVVPLTKTILLNGVTSVSTSDVYWVSSNPAVAAVNTTGKVKIKSAGVANIIATTEDCTCVGYIRLVIT